MFTPSGQLDLLSFMGVRGGGGGGKGGAPPAQQAAPVAPQFVDPVTGKVYSDRNEYNTQIDARTGNEQSRSAQDTAAAAAKAEQDQGAWNTQRDTAYNDALTNVQRAFQTEGLDPNAYMTSDIQPRLNQQKNSIANLSPNPGSAFSPTLGKDIINDLTSGRRTQVGNQLDTLFAPDYANKLISDESMNPSIQSLLSEQFDPLTKQLENARSRRTLNDTGYNAALNALGAKRTGAQATLGNLGRNILGADRSAINDIVGGARTAASGLRLGQQFDPTSYDTQARSRAQQEQASFGGELRSAVGDTKYADLTELLNAGGSVQGAINPAEGMLGQTKGESPFYVSPEEEANKKRGLGNTGAF